MKLAKTATSQIFNVRLVEFLLINFYINICMYIFKGGCACKFSRDVK